MSRTSSEKEKKLSLEKTVSCSSSEKSPKMVEAKQESETEPVTPAQAANSVQNEEKKAESGPEEPKYPSKEWFTTWKATLLLPNIKACIQHTYSKAMQYRNHMIESDSQYQANQIVNIDEDVLASYLQKFSLKGLLPLMPKILVTTYKGN